MTKNAKVCLIYLGIIITMITLFFGMIYHNIETSRERADADIAEQQDICQKKLEVDKNQILTFINFNKTEIIKCKVFLIRRNTIINTYYLENIEMQENKKLNASISFPFLKTDVLLFGMPNKIFYKLSNFNFQTNASERWTAMGYNGLFEPCSCDLTSFRLNKKDSISVISKKEGLKIYDLPK